jgi:hypothetical protein
MIDCQTDNLNRENSDYETLRTAIIATIDDLPLRPAPLLLSPIMAEFLTDCGQIDNQGHMRRAYSRRLARNAVQDAALDANIRKDVANINAQFERGYAAIEQAEQIVEQQWPRPRQAVDLETFQRRLEALPVGQLQRAADSLGSLTAGNRDYATSPRADQAVEQQPLRPQQVMTWKPSGAF